MGTALADNIGVILNNLMPIISAALMAIVTYWIVPLLKQHFTKQQLQNAYNIAKIAVKAAEQTALTTTADEKKQYALSYLKSKGFTISDDDLENMIESAVLELKKGLDING